MPLKIIPLGTPETPIVGFGQASIKFSLESTDVDNGVQIFEQALTVAKGRVEKRTSLIAKELLAAIFDEAMERLSEQQFAPKFRERVLETVAAMKIKANVDPTKVILDIDFGQLGGKDDLVKAFHRHALLKGGGKLLDEYAGQELYIEDTQTRHDYFEAMLYGDPYLTANQGEVQTTGKWERTQEEYLRIWGNKAPQWLYLQYGQGLWEPKIPPANIIENFTAEFETVSTIIMEEEIDLAVKLANKEQYGITSSQYGNRAPKGGINLRGRSYPGGRFVFKR